MSCRYRETHDEDITSGLDEPYSGGGSDLVLRPGAMHRDKPLLERLSSSFIDAPACEGEEASPLSPRRRGPQCCVQN